MKKILTTGFLLIAFVGSHVLASNTVGGVDHVGLSVTKLEETKAFFVEQLNFKVLGKNDKYPAFFLGNGEVIITLWKVTNPDKAVKFNRKENVGLHHLAFSVESFDKLQSIYQSMKKLKNVKIEFAPELLGKGPTKHMMIYEPSGNRIEFIHRVKPS